MTKEPKNKRTLQGVVVSDKMTKTRVVAVTRMTRHPKYLKYIKVTRRFKAHDEKNEYKKGDVVIIAESRPLSRDKRWTIVKKIERSHESLVIANP